jgi:membrane protein YdbS with pleckstrin-like domain
MAVPAEPPHLSGAQDAQIRAFRPAEGYLRYRKLFFWIGLALVDIALGTAWIILLVTVPLAGIVLAPVFWFVIIAPDILVYIGIHLRYDTTWYVLSDRTMRLRRGIWIIHEVTITYENIQNVAIRQGPIQRLFGISDIVVQTAGGGGPSGPHGEQSLSGHQGFLEGIDNAVEVRDLIMAKWKSAKSAGLGDERHGAAVTAARSDRPSPAFGPAEQQVLEQIRDLAVKLAHSLPGSSVETRR